MTDLAQRLIDLMAKLSGPDAETCRDAKAIIDRLPKDANGVTYTHGDVLRLTTDPTLRAVAVMCVKPLSDDGCVSYCTLAGTWAKVDSTEQAACRAAKGE